MRNYSQHTSQTRMSLTETTGAHMLATARALWLSAIKESSYNVKSFTRNNWDIKVFWKTIYLAFHFTKANVTLLVTNGNGKTLWKKLKVKWIETSFQILFTAKQLNNFWTDHSIDSQG